MMPVIKVAGPHVVRRALLASAGVLACTALAGVLTRAQDKTSLRFDDLGSPLPSVRDIPPGDYYVQGFVNIYSAFPRADGHVVWMHDDRWEGQRWPRSPGNLYSTVQRVRIDPRLGGVIRLSC